MELIKLERPQLPKNWNYDESVKKVSGLIYKWKNLTEEIALELWIAREMLSQVGNPNWNKSSNSQTWSQYCKDIGSSRQVINRGLKRWFSEEREETETPLLPPGKFAVIYADPPWQYSNTGFDESAQSQYSTMSDEKIINLKDSADRAIQDLAADQTVLFLWATNPLIPEAINVLHGWQFEYKTNMAWIKDRGRGKGWWLKSKHELLFIGVRSKTPKPSIRLDSCFQAPRHKKHSRKPYEVYDFIESMYPGPLNESFYVELFAREAKKGWKAWGKEI